MWRGLMLAASGQLEDLRRVLAGCGSIESRSSMVQALRDAGPAVSQRGFDGAVMGWLRVALLVHYCIGGRMLMLVSVFCSSSE